MRAPAWEGKNLLIPAPVTSDLEQGSKEPKWPFHFGSPLVFRRPSSFIMSALGEDVLTHGHKGAQQDLEDCFHGVSATATTLASKVLWYACEQVPLGVGTLAQNIPCDTFHSFVFLVRHPIPKNPKTQTLCGRHLKLLTEGGPELFHTR